MSKRILIIGCTRRIEFQESCHWLTQNYACAQFDSISLVPSQPVHSPSDVILFQSVRGEFSESQINDLRRRFPLANFCCVYGSWVEGETRSGRPLPGVHRISSQQFVSVMRHAPENHLPTTSAADERWLDAEILESPIRKEEARKVLVVGYDRALVDGLAMACSELGFFVITGSPRSFGNSIDANCVIYDAAREHRSRATDVRRLKRVHQNAHLCVLIDFPRVDEKEEMIRAGASEVVAKPFNLAQLFFDQSERLNS